MPENEARNKASIYAQLPSGIDVTIELSADDRVFLETQVDTIVNNLRLTPRGAVGFGGGVKTDAEPAKPDPAAPQCNCGKPMEYKEGRSKAGNDYKGWFCTKPGREKCPPIWINEDDPSEVPFE